MNIFVIVFLSIFALASGCATDSDCQDGRYCNGQETCSGTTCLPASEVPCPFYVECIELGNNTGMCLAFTGCIEYPDMCVDGTYCNEVIDTCLPNSCTSDSDCSDYTPCTGDEQCVLGKCTNADPSTWICANPLFCNPIFLNCTKCTSASQCDDGVACNGIEVCSPDGYCVSGQAICTEHGYICDEPTGTCIMNLEAGAMIITISIFIMLGISVLSVIYYLVLRCHVEKKYKK